MTNVKPAQRRRRAREYAVQAIFQWSVNKLDANNLCNQYLENYDFSTADVKFFMTLVTGIINHIETLDREIATVITRDIDSMSLLIKSILRIAVYELIYLPAVPYKVVINEAIELQKSYGADEGRSFVNAVLDKLAPSLRSAEYNSIIR